MALLTDRLIHHAVAISPAGYELRQMPHPSRWREFRFMFHQVCRAIDPRIRMVDVLEELVIYRRGTS